ncbi:MAG: hypothetical protein GKR88_04250 [Flavobacteriaceae bacterium]|nr:MAG: hypothetical protein GKR88_04250 [Flavobacteriaceae bacterium]
MTNNNIVNEYYLEFIDDSYCLKCRESYNKTFKDVTNQSVWETLTSNYCIKDLHTLFIWVFLITDDNKIKGFCKLEWEAFRDLKVNEILRITLMVDVKNIMFATNLLEEDGTIDTEVPIRMTNLFQKRLSPLKINVLDTLIVNDAKYFSLKSN